MHWDCLAPAFTPTQRNAFEGASPLFAVTARCVLESDLPLQRGDVVAVIGTVRGSSSTWLRGYAVDKPNGRVGLFPRHSVARSSYTEGALADETNWRIKDATLENYTIDLRPGGRHSIIRSLGDVIDPKLHGRHQRFRQ
eukprot:SAG31_NODE_10938_length_1081_cov_1.262729_1_plen_139_part_00